MNRFGIVALFVAGCASVAPVQSNPPGHPDRGLCEWCVEMARTAPECSLVEDCDRCR